MYPADHSFHPQNPAGTPNSNPDTRSLLAWLTLAHTRGLHSRLFNRLLDLYSNPESILACEPVMLERAGVDGEVARTIHAAGHARLPVEVSIALEKCIAWQEDEQNAIVWRGSPDYPALLAAIPDPPPLLYVRGDSSSLHMPMIAMVGSRRPSADGRRHARRFAGELAATGLGICSGLALGVDVESHAGALQAKGYTVAVLGTGIDGVYPARNRDMFDRITESGALVSEFNPGTPPLPGNFPRRNRIISGLSLGVLVVEAGLQSGSMITARMALEQGRDVYAIPGSIHNPMAKGCHHLIGQGAKLVQQVEDITSECTGLLHSCIESVSKQASTLPKTELSKEQEKILFAIGHDPVSLDTLVSETGVQPHLASAAVVELELLGLVSREAAGFVIAVGD